MTCAATAPGGGPVSRYWISNAPCSSRAPTMSTAKPAEGRLPRKTPAIKAAIYLDNASTGKLAEFFEAKGLPALKEGDQTEQWYDDWLVYQKTHRLYASILGAKQNGSPGFSFDLLTYARFLEVFGHYSPAHGYSLQVTFLGFFSILLGTNAALKTEARTRNGKRCIRNTSACSARP